MIKHAVILLLGALPLAACNSSPSVEAKNATVAEVAAKVEQAGGTDSFLRPGKWLTKATLEELSAPGMPPGIADNMKAMMAKKPGTEQCMKESDVKKPNADFFAGNKDCEYDHFKMGDGVIDAKMRCTSGGHTQLMTMAGDYKPDEYHMAMTTEMDRGASAAGPMGSMTMKMRVEGKRVGECDTKAS
ncbi:MAG: DUF3617 domain-containing protein [Sphingomicrobium sp.]